MMKGYAMMGIGKTQWIEKEKPTCGYRDAICCYLYIGCSYRLGWSYWR